MGWKLQGKWAKAGLTCLYFLCEMRELTAYKLTGEICRREGKIADARDSLETCP